MMSAVMRARLIPACLASKRALYSVSLFEMGVCDPAGAEMGFGFEQVRARIPKAAHGEPRPLILQNECCRRAPTPRCYGELFVGGAGGGSFSPNKTNNSVSRCSEPGERHPILQKQLGGDFLTKSEV